jgi:hypothetical protein
MRAAPITASDPGFAHPGLDQGSRCTKSLLDEIECGPCNQAIANSRFQRSPGDDILQPQSQASDQEVPPQ